MSERLKGQIPPDSVPLAAGEVTAVDSDVIELTETVRGETWGYTSIGSDNDDLIEALASNYRGNPGSGLYRFETEDSTGRLVKAVISLEEAVELINRGTASDPAFVELVTGGESKLEINRKIAPRRTKVGDKLGIWIGKRIELQSGSATGKANVTAVRKLPKPKTNIN